MENRWKSFQSQIDADGGLVRGVLNTLQINVGKLCNQVCLHCHVDAGPHKKRENMDWPTFSRIISLAEQSPGLTTVDLTGGAPEMNPHFRTAVSAFRSMGLDVMDRCNLTVLSEPGQEDTASFLAEHRVKVVASLPCYSRDNVDKQRGEGVFGKSIDGLLALNQLGYGKQGSGLILDLVYNPTGPFLPPNQATLERDYRNRLFEDFGICFNNLFTVTNMPIKRFLFDLKKSGRFGEYMTLLVDSYNPSIKDKVMCRNVLSISWDGKVYDCDFNQMVGMSAKVGASIWQMENFEFVEGKGIALADHCYGCTAGAGSSCGGSLDA